MQNLKAFLLIGCLVLLGAFLVPKAKANQIDQKTTVTFSRPVELPGIVLPADTYVFRLLNMTDENTFVQVLSADEQEVYAVLHAIPDYRVRITDKTVFTFEKRAPGAPEAIKDWFFPDRHYGEEFVYSNIKATHPAKTTASMTKQ